MQTLFDYYELMISVDATKFCRPLEFVCKRGENECIVRVIFEKGLYNGLEFYTDASMVSIDDADKLNVQKIIENNLEFALRQWMDFHIYGQSVKIMVLKSRIHS